ncbi:MAG TPA: bifunctional glycosyltransferase/class I SAM-dependent methyltransferase [Bryobacteraceae bacterium]|jgi:2-polyprenyl-3-methyl-5-hydroxy-6-metoxy-1,4-benzoquinol methylase|nr:bifunctional glycosyltransferase/class I SAM-dependent methyltransferase [Bryobacteraceae bacterium]
MPCVYWEANTLSLLTDSIQNDLSLAHNRGKRIGVVLLDASPNVDRALDRIPPAVWSNLEEVIFFGPGDFADDDRRPKVTSLPGPSINEPGALRKAAFAYFLDRGFDIVALLRSDGLYPLELLAGLYRPIVADQADAVFGSPNFNHGGPLNELEKMMFGIDLSNFHCGYRAYSFAALRAVEWQRLSDGETFDLELILKLRHQNFRIRELPIPGDCGSRVPFLHTLKQSIETVYRYRQTRRSVKRYPEFEEYFVHYPIKESNRSSHAYAETLVGTGNEVLDIGCGEGILAAKLRANGNRVTGADILAQAANESALEQYFSVDLNHGIEPMVHALHGKTFDRVLLLDVLEHLVRPEPLLEQCRRLLKPDGQLILSVPNIANLTIRLSLLFGQFDYSERGILDKTHVRFFTRKTIRRMLRENGYSIVEERETVMPVELFFGLAAANPLMRFANNVLGVLTRTLPGLFGYQIMLVLKAA